MRLKWIIYKASIIIKWCHKMQNPSLRKDELRARKIYLYTFYFCAATMLIIFIYALAMSTAEYLNTGRIVIGEVLVDTEFPMVGLAKLVTYLMIVTVVGWYCVTKIGKSQARKLPKSWKALFQLIVLAIAITALYEFLYNFVVWNSFITVDMTNGLLRLDDINVPYPNPETPWNLVFATKMSLAAFLISAHGFYVISKSEEKTD
jgi:magnesium-transporting ATPase (P-type)